MLARTQHAAALALATEIGDRYEQARAQAGLARLRFEAGDAIAARDGWRRALELYVELGVPDAEEIHTRLAELEDC
ncbi:hypothetical protein [Streptomyces sp. YIM S03343]